MKIGMYMRISKKEGESIENQRKIINNYINENGELKKCIREEFIDEGISGKNMKRKALEKLLKKIHDGEIETIIFKDFSRIGRNYVEIGELLEVTMPVYGIRVISVNDNFDSDKKHFSLVQILYCIMNEMYIRDISWKVKVQKKMKIEKGAFTGGTDLYGYRRKEDKYLIDERQAETVKMIFDSYCSGKSCVEISMELNKRKINTPMGNKKGIEMKWNRCSVNRILREEAYCGVKIGGKRSYSIKEVRTEGIFPMIIEKELFVKAREMMKKNKGRKKK